MACFVFRIPQNLSVLKPRLLARNVSRRCLVLVSGANTSGSNSTVTGISATANNAVVGGDNQQQQQNSSPVRNGGAATQQPSGGSFSTAVPDLEVNCWTKKDAAGTPFENGNRLDTQYFIIIYKFLKDHSSYCIVFNTIRNRVSNQDCNSH